MREERGDEMPYSPVTPLFFFRGGVKALDSVTYAVSSMKVIDFNRLTSANSNKHQ